jgi:hypothetical protein
MVENALVLEKRRGIIECRKKMQCSEAQVSNTRFRVGFSSQGPNFLLGQQSGQQRMQIVGHGFNTPQRQIQHPNFQTPRFALSSPQRDNQGQNIGAVGPSNNCGQNGYYANICPRKQAN